MPSRSNVQPLELPKGPVKVKAPREEFEAAADGGYVYGYLTRRAKIPVYVRLGTEQEYIPKADDDPSTEYKYFFECDVAVAETDEQLDQEDYLGWWCGVAVILFC